MFEFKTDSVANVGNNLLHIHGPRLQPVFGPANLISGTLHQNQFPDLNFSHSGSYLQQISEWTTRRQFVLPQVLEGQFVVDLGAGNSSDACVLASKFKAAGYVAIDHLNGSELRRNIEADPRLDKTVAVAVVDGDVLDILPRLDISVKEQGKFQPQKYSFLAFGFDSHIVIDGSTKSQLDVEREFEFLAQCLDRLHPNGVIICADYDTSIFSRDLNSYDVRGYLGYDLPKIAVHRLGCSDKLAILSFETCDNQHLSNLVIISNLERDSRGPENL